MYVLSAGFVLMIGAVSMAFIGSPSPYVPGAVVVIGLVVAGFAIYWAAYLGHQRSVEIRDGHLHVRSWLRWWRLGTDRSIDLGTVTSALLLRPHHVELAIPGASTRVGTFYSTKRGVDRFGTFWWYDDDYLLLRDELLRKGIETEYRHYPGIGSIITAR
jgi:hypothetical protein